MTKRRIDPAVSPLPMAGDTKGEFFINTISLEKRLVYRRPQLLHLEWDEYVLL